MLQCYRLLQDFYHHNHRTFKCKESYIVFILSNSVALFSSSSSIILFLIVLSSGFSKDEFSSSLVRLMLGFTTLFVAITAMVVAFTAACFLIFKHLSTWVACVVASLGSITLALNMMLLYNLLGDTIWLLYWSRHLFRKTNYFRVCVRLMKGTTTWLSLKYVMLKEGNQPGDGNFNGISN